MYTYVAYRSVTEPKLGKSNDRCHGIRYCRRHYGRVRWAVFAALNARYFDKNNLKLLINSVPRNPHQTRLKFTYTVLDSCWEIAGKKINSGTRTRRTSCGNKTVINKNLIHVPENWGFLFSTTLERMENFKQIPLRPRKMCCSSEKMNIKDSK